jgi:hypothetical protein
MNHALNLRRLWRVGILQPYPGLEIGRAASVPSVAKGTSALALVSYTSYLLPQIDLLGATLRVESLGDAPSVSIEGRGLWCRRQEATPGSHTDGRGEETGVRRSSLMTLSALSTAAQERPRETLKLAG